MVAPPPHPLFRSWLVYRWVARVGLIIFAKITWQGRSPSHGTYRTVVLMSRRTSTSPQYSTVPYVVPCHVIFAHFRFNPSVYKYGESIVSTMCIVGRLYCKRPILCQASSFDPPPLHRPASVHPPPALMLGEDTLAGWRGGWGVNILETRQTQLCTLHM